MKWYEDVKIKVLGFILLAAFVFIVSFSLIFSLIQDKSLKEDAAIYTSSATAGVLSKIMIIQGRMEEIVLSLASAAKNQKEESEILQAIVSVDRLHRVASAGVWFEPYAKFEEQKNHSHFYNKSKKGHFFEVSKGLTYKAYPYREMDFYKLGKTLKDQEVSWTNAYTDPLTRKRMVTVVTPIYHDKRFMGVANIDVEITTKESTFFLRDFAENDHYFLLIDAAGTLIGRSKIFRQYVDKETNIYSVASPEVVLLLEEIKPMLLPCNTDACKQEVHERGFSSALRLVKNDPILNKSSAMAVYQLPTSGWKVIIGLAQEKVLKQANKIYDDFMLTTLILTLLATLFGILILRKET